MTRVPEELIDEIVSYFAIPGPTYDDVDFKTLCRLARVSKQFYRIVQPHLYTHVCGGSHGRSAKLLETIQKKPWLGLHVKSLRANGTTLTDHLQFPARYLVRDRENASSKQLQKYYKAHFRDILVCLPNLEYLDVSKPKHDLRIELGEMPPWLNLINYSRFMPLCGGQSFDKLRRLEADIHEMEIIELYNVFSLPQLEMLTLHRGTMDYSGDMNAMTRRQYSRAWNFCSRTLKILHFVGLEPGHLAWPMLLLARAVPHVQDLSFIGTPGRGYGSNLFRFLMGVFLRVITRPTFRRLEMWDMQTTPPDQWCSGSGWRFWHEVVLHSPVEVLVVDANIIAGPSTQAYLPDDLEEFWLRSNVSTVTRFAQDTLDDYMADFRCRLVLDQYTWLTKCHFFLQKTDIFARELFNQRYLPAFEDRGIKVDVQ